MKDVARNIDIPEAYREGIRLAAEILRGAGCSSVFLFGPVSRGGPPGEDIDLAVRGCPRGQFFHLLGKLMLELDHPIDLIDLDRQDALARHLEEEGRLVRVG